jgi:hypothetical protein
VCPVSLDDETGPFLHNKIMEQGMFCRPLAEYPTEITVHLRPSSYVLPSSELGVLTQQAQQQQAIKEIAAEAKSSPAELRNQQAKAQLAADYRPHAVCTVQTFRNAQTGSFNKFVSVCTFPLIIYNSHMCVCFMKRRDAVHVHCILSTNGMEVSSTNSYNLWYFFALNRMRSVFKISSRVTVCTSISE